jgi:prophage antirepressor-like protein
VTIGSDPWFVAADVCRALGLAVSHTGYVEVWNANRHLPPTEKMTLPKGSPHLTRGAFGAAFGNKAPSVGLVSEPGLYKLAMRSDKPQAKAFQDWIAYQVLPSIRKHGIYVAGQEKVATGEMTLLLESVGWGRSQAAAQRSHRRPWRSPAS